MRAVFSFDLLFNGLETCGRSSKKKNLKKEKSLNKTCQISRLFSATFHWLVKKVEYNNMYKRKYNV